MESADRKTQRDFEEAELLVKLERVSDIQGLLELLNTLLLKLKFVHVINFHSNKCLKACSYKRDQG